MVDSADGELELGEEFDEEEVEERVGERAELDGAEDELVEFGDGVVGGALAEERGERGRNRGGEVFAERRGLAREPRRASRDEMRGDSVDSSACLGDDKNEESDSHSV